MDILSKKEMRVPYSLFYIRQSKQPDSIVCRSLLNFISRDMCPFPSIGSIRLSSTT